MEPQENDLVVEFYSNQLILTMEEWRNTLLQLADEPYMQEIKAPVALRALADGMTRGLETLYRRMP